jgi:hypothetical protein
MVSGTLRVPDALPREQVVSQELVYTSAPRGLAPGSHGFCTVASTRGMVASLAQQLEALSGYRQIYSPQDSRASLNPVAFSHLVLTIAGRRCHVLSRVCDAGLDYTQRTNKFAHHVVLDPAEVPPAGPAWLLAAPGFMRSRWDGAPQLLPAGPLMPAGQSPPRICRAWQQAAGDAGWGGALAEAATANRQAVLVFAPGTDMLALVDESLALLPAELRWRVTFSTYFTKLPAGVACQWRCVVDGTPEAVAARHGSQAVLIIDLCRSLGRAGDGPYQAAARTGKTPSLVSAPRSSAAAVPAAPAAEMELEEALRLADEAPVGLSARPALPPRGGLGSLLVPPPAPPARPPRIPQPFQPRRRRPVWPWALAAAAVVFSFAGVGVAVWVASTGPGGADAKNVAAASGTKGRIGKKEDGGKKTPQQLSAAPNRAGQQPVASSKPAAQNPPPGARAAAAEKAEKKGKDERGAGDLKIEPSKPVPALGVTDPHDPQKKIHPKAKDWFEGLPSAVELPEAPIGQGNSDAAPLNSGHDWTMPDRCSLWLLGGEQLFGYGNTCVVKEVKKATPRRWKFILSVRQLASLEDFEVAELTLDRSLLFRWLPAPKEVGGLPDQLRNCILEFKVGKETRCVALRRPVTEGKPFLFKLLERGTFAPQPCEIALLPKEPAKLKIQIMGFDPAAPPTCAVQRRDDRLELSGAEAAKDSKYCLAIALIGHVVRDPASDQKVRISLQFKFPDIESAQNRWLKEFAPATHHSSGTISDGARTYSTSDIIGLFRSADDGLGKKINDRTKTLRDDDRRSQKETDADPEKCALEEKQKQVKGILRVADVLQSDEAKWCYRVYANVGDGEHRVVLLERKSQGGH